MMILSLVQRPEIKQRSLIIINVYDCVYILTINTPVTLFLKLSPIQFFNFLSSNITD